jgi:uncharacterized protein
VKELRTKHRCHTVILYGSRARGLTTPTSDYDVLGIKRGGKKLRIAKKDRGFYWDVFVYPEKDLRKLGETNLAWKNAKIIHGEGDYGRRLLRRIASLVKKPYRRQPGWEIATTQVWAQKELDRIRMNDIQALYRRAEFQMALIEHYFLVRQRRFWGPKAGFAWIARHDPQTFRAIRRALASPKDLGCLRVAASRVYRTRLV